MPAITAEGPPEWFPNMANVIIIYTLQMQGSLNAFLGERRPKQKEEELSLSLLEAD